MSAVLGQTLVGALLVGMIYAVVAVGFSLYFGVLNIIQFSHGEMYMLGPFIVLSIASGNELLLIWCAVALLLTGLAGVAFARITVRPLLSSPPLITLLATMAGGEAIREVVRLFYPNGSAVQSFPQLFPSSTVHIGQVVIHTSDMLIFAIGAAALIATLVFIRESQLGREMRAVAQDREAAQVMGTNLARVIATTFFLASALGALAGILYGSHYNAVRYDMGLSAGVIGFAAAVVGGLGSLNGAIVGGFGFALVQGLSAAYLPGGSKYASALTFLIVILFLAFRSQGVFGERVTERV